MVTWLRRLRADFRAAYAEREAELRAALLPAEDAVADARSRRTGTPADDEPPYSFF